MTAFSAPLGDLCLGTILESAGLDPQEVLVVRHTYNADGIATPDDATPERILAYTRQQDLINKIGRTPPRLWLVFMADGQRRSRLRAAYENHGEVAAERTAALRYFDLRPSNLLANVRNRLVLGWSRDTVNWAKSGTTAATFPVIEIADLAQVPFPGFDNVRLTYAELQTMVIDSRYAAWRAALGAVQGIYLIADSSTGQLYVGKADGSERILGRWASYAKDGHGGNVALRDLIRTDPKHSQHFSYSILRVFGPNATSTEVDQAEEHYKKALMTRKYGLNRN